MLFGDINHPEVKGVISYATNQALVVNSLEELQEKSSNEKWL